MHSSTPTRAPKADHHGRVSWYATTPRTRRVPPWYVWCGVVALLCGVVRVVAGHSPAELIFGAVVLGLTIAAWRE